MDRCTPLTDEAALELANAPRADLFAAACAIRDRRWGRQLTYSPKVFLPVTNLCRDHCAYCTFRRSPGEVGAKTMTPDEIQSVLTRGRELGCTEALLCLGDRPDIFPGHRTQLEQWGHSSTLAYLEWVSERALSVGLLPHTNAGVLGREEMVRLRESNVSMGLMLEQATDRLCGVGMPHHRAPDKRPGARLEMMAVAGELRIPFTTGLLIGIGETWCERVESLLAIRGLHRQYGHIQEVIIQPFRPHEGTPMARSSDVGVNELARVVALARLILDEEVSVQSPPNLSDIGALIAAGVNDFGGISPVTPDFINPKHPWPHIVELREQCRALGFDLVPRLPVYDRWVAEPGFLSAQLGTPISEARRRVATVHA
jgi:FO synthase